MSQSRESPAAKQVQDLHHGMDGKVQSENEFGISLRHDDARGVQTLCKKKKKKHKTKRWFQVDNDRSQPHNRVITGQTHAFEWTIAPMDGRTDGCTIDRFVGSLSTSYHNSLIHVNSIGRVSDDSADLMSDSLTLWTEILNGRKFSSK